MGLGVFVGFEKIPGPEEEQSAGWVYDHEPWDHVFAVAVGRRWDGVHMPLELTEALDEIADVAELMDPGTPEFIEFAAGEGGLTDPEGWA